MKNRTLKIASLVTCATLGAAIAQSNYSGIYSGKLSGDRVLIAISAGARVIGVGDGAEGLGDVLDPTKSTVSATGRLKGQTPGGASLAATINSSYQFSGSVKEGGRTFRLSGKRIYK